MSAPSNKRDTMSYRSMLSHTLNATNTMEVNMLHKSNVAMNATKVNSVDELFGKVFGNLMLPDVQAETAELLSIEPKYATIRHMILTIKVTVVKSDDPAMAGVVKTEIVGLTPNEDMKDPVEKRICLYPKVGDAEVLSVTVLFVGSDDASKLAFDDKSLDVKFGEWLKSMGYDLMGGTSLNKGTFYLVNWKSHGIKLAHESIGYLSLLLTGAGSFRDGQPMMFGDGKEQVRVLVVTRDELRKTGLAGDGAGLAFRTFGQHRTLLNGKSVAKGIYIGYNDAINFGLQVPKDWMDYHFVICEDDVKINPVKAGIYTGHVVITHDNVWTIRGQEVKVGFEVFQNIKESQGVYSLLTSRVLNASLPSYEEIVARGEAERMLEAIADGTIDEYEPLVVRSTLMEAVLSPTFGPRNPWVANKLENSVVNYVFSKPMAGTEFRIVVVVDDTTAKRINAIRLADDTQRTSGKLFFKYPVVAGVAVVTGRNHFGPFVVVSESLAAMLNTDSDGDGAVVWAGNTVDYIINNDLVKDLVDLKIDKANLQRRDDAMEPVNLAKQALHIMNSSRMIGFLTNLYYRGAVSNAVGLTQLDLSPIYESIELVIKGAKYKTEEVLKATMARLWTDIPVKALNDMIKMPWGRSAVEKMLAAFNEDGNIDILSSRIDDPIHYMDAVWNATLDRCSMEIGKLRSNVLPLSEFANRISNPSNPEDVSTAYKELHGILLAWKELRPGGIMEGRADVMAKIAAAAGQHFSLDVRRKITKDYLEKTASKTGAFAIHLNFGSMTELSGGPSVMKAADSRYKLVRVFCSGDGAFEVTPEVCDDIKLDSGMFYRGNTIFNYGSGYSEADVDGYEVEEVVPYLTWNKEARKITSTRSAWILLSKSN